ncbi:hypothetical protein POF45_11500 [Pseudomonas sp. 681]|uniref:Methyl-accepting chemotaxis protein n=1 Tax=Pseudomonas fungipugnans TaxID=3024217 RepID=A0ABT6QMC3_9PSED|nr:hypothetical protein [Pseudomonas sp. 681]MDI2592046.1 hypothetical protein [Pseudomonas sp. 681]
MRNGSSLALDSMQASASHAANTLVLAERAGEAREVDRNLLNIRDLSVRSAAGADQTSASSHELSKLANALQGMVQRFQV